MAKSFYYGDASYGRTGIMVCAACNKPIEDGEYRYRETAERYINVHRACCAGDPEWARIDKARASAKNEYREFIKDCRMMNEKWGAKFDLDLDEHLSAPTIKAEADKCRDDRDLAYAQHGLREEDLP